MTAPRSTRSCIYGRHIPALLRTVLELGDPERLDGAVCVEAGCDRRHELEWDHDDPVANDGVTSYENLNARCQPDHWTKTERDRKAGKLGRRTSAAVISRRGRVEAASRFHR